MDHDTRGDAIINTTTHEQDEDHRDAMEVDGAPSMMIDTSHSHDSIVDNGVTPVETNAAVSPMVTTTNEATAPSSQSRDFGSAPDTPRSVLPGSREPPAFDEDTERPRQRRRYHVTVEDENTGEIRTITDTTPATTGGTSAGEDEVAVLVTAPPRLGDLSIHTPRSATPPPAATVESAMQDVVPSPPAPAAPRGSSNPQSPHIGTIPLPDVPPPPPRNPNEPPDPVMQAARRLTTAPDGNADQLQADLALLAPYIAAQAMAAAFPPGGGRPPGGAPGGGAPNPSNGAPNPGNGAPNAPNGQQQPEGQGGTNNAGPPPFPFPFGFPFMFGGNTEVPPDPKRAERLANGLKVVEDGLLKRWRAVCGEEGAVCAVCYGELLEEPGIEKEKEKGKAKEEDENAMDGQADGEDQSAGDEEAHSRALREALKRREEMEKLERQEKELKLETAVLAFPCGHVFHRTCLLPWLSRHTTCPTCRFDIDPKSDTLTVPADDGMPPFLGPNGFNFGDFFTVGPVLRMPRAHAPNLGPRPVPGHNHTHEHDPGHRRERRDSNQPADGSRPRPSGDADNAGASRSMNDLFDSLFGPLFEAVGTPAARRPAATTPAQPSQEPAGQEPAAPVAAQEASTQEAPAQSTQPSETPASRTPPSIADLDLPRSRTGPPIATEYRPIDYNRPLAMFGRPSPRRPPQPVTPAWMRPPRPPPTTSTPGTSTAPAPSTSAARASSAPASTPSASTTRAEPTPSSRPAAPSGSQPTDSSRGLGQIRAIVSNLIPRRLNASARAARSTASIRSNRSNESAGSSSATQTGPRPALTPLSPRAGIRAILQGPTALLRDLASRRPADPETEDRPRDSVDTLPRQSLGDDMPGLESDTEDGSTYSEDDAHTSEDDADMPALEPVEPRVPRAPAASTSESQSTPGNNAQPPPPVSSSTQESAQPSQSTSNGTNADQPPTFGPPRPPADDNPNMMDNIITLRIDLGHADGRDETIIVPLLFNPSGRNNDQNQRGEPRPAAAQPPPPSRQRTPPPPKKWVPPEPIKTFRQVVEEKEREAGWRCDDPACLLGPADDEEPSNEHPIKPMYSIMRSLSPDDDTPRYKIEDGIRVYAGGEDVRVKGENPVCAHQLHPECLVTSARVNGWGPDHNSKSNSRVTLRCPVCRLEGTVERQIWDAGVEAEEAGEA